MNNLQASDFNQMYNIIESMRNQLYPYRLNLIATRSMLNNPLNPFAYTIPGNVIKASVDMAERLTRRYEKPEFGIKESEVDGIVYPVEYETIDKEAFCNLAHFSKKGFPRKLPKMMLVAPLAGHHATLLKKTIIELLPHFDVFVTDWIDACQVPLIYGKFDMDDYINYIIQFIEDFDERIHVMAVCQPTVPVLAASAIMSEAKSDKVPLSMTLVGGPIDARENPTAVNDFANNKSLKWFEDSLIMTVPNNYPGAGRKVYPGFLQLAGFISMNWKNHLQSHMELFSNIVENNQDKVDFHKNFYDEYLSVMDLPAEYYIQTIREVFQRYSLAKGTLKSKSREVNLKSIKNCAILGVEGENDDIAAVGQTKAALELCTGIPSEKKHYHLQKEVGHYGVFSGSKFKKYIVPVIKEFAYKYSEEKPKKV
jgi:poly(3-hydroxybutyrate) depolymerase